MTVSATTWTLRGRAISQLQLQEKHQVVTDFIQFVSFCYVLVYYFLVRLLNLSIAVCSRTFHIVGQR